MISPQGNRWAGFVAMGCRSGYSPSWRRFAVTSRFPPIGGETEKLEGKEPH